MSANKELFFMQSLYLSYFGERAGTYVIEELLKREDIPTKILDYLHYLVADERKHVKMYESILDTTVYDDIRFGPLMKELLLPMDKLSLKLFSLQVILESVAMGVLQFRIKNWKDYFCIEIDKEILREEAEHKLGIYTYMDDMKEYEILEKSEFEKVVQEFDKLFKSAFHPKESKRFFEIKGEEFNTKEFMQSAHFKGMTEHNYQSIQKGIDKFYKAYFN